MKKVSRCECCGETWILDDDEYIIMEPFPHIVCPQCGGMIPLF